MRSRGQDFIDIDVEWIEKETEKAFLAIIEQAKVWIPKGQIGNLDQLSVGLAECQVSVTEWWAEKAGILRG